MEQKLTVEQAFQLIDGAVAQLSLQRKDHEILLQALSIVKEKITTPPGVAPEIENG